MENLHSIQIIQSNLSLRLRGVLAIAERMAGKLDDVDVIRIHIETKKVTYLITRKFSKLSASQDFKEINNRFPRTLGKNNNSRRRR